MIITCEQCETSFNLDEALLKPEGSKVRCSKCKHIFIAYPPAPAGEVEEPPLLDETDIAGKDVEETAEASLAAETRDETDEEELDLSDLDEELMLTGADDDEAAADAPPEEDMLLDFSLDGEEEAPAAAETEEEDLDLSDLDEALGLTEEEAQATEDASSEEDMSLDFSLDSEEKAPAAAETEEEELDLSDLDEALGLTEEEAQAAEDASSEEDLSLDFSLDDEEKAPIPTEAAEEELDLSGLEDAAAGEPVDADLSLDLDIEEKKPAASESESEELDLSDIESMLEEATPVKTSNKTVESEAGIEVETEEIDLSELEKMLDADEDNEPAVGTAEETEDLELDLDIEIEPEPETDTDAGGKEAALESKDLDLKELETELVLDETPAAKVQTDLSEDLELEFITEELQEEELQLDEVTAEKISDDAADEILMTIEDKPAAPTAKAEERIDFESEAEEKAVKKPRKKKAAVFKPQKRVNPLLVTFLVIVLLIGAVVMLPTFGIRIPFVSDFVKNIPIADYLRNIPYVGDLLGSKVDERGNLKMATFDIQSKFAENSKSGTLFVISGKVRNGYDHPRAFVKVTGRLYAKGKKLSKVQTVFCGNTLTDKELSSLDMEAVRKKLLVRTGQKQSNVRVPPGMHVPFMLVFSNLPPDLEEFDIQIEESFPAT